MHIKICGITNLDDALAALEAGADYLGFNFYPRSPRCISPGDCARLRSAIPTLHTAATMVGVFVNAAPADVAAILDDCGLDLAQVHGGEPPDYLATFQGRAFKGLRGLPAGTPIEAFARQSAGRPALLLDAYTPGAYGGTGHTGDWTAARAVAIQFPILLAGGLTPENVAEAIAQACPWGVDVASGVESAPGRKDWRLMRSFVRTAQEQGRRGAGAQSTPSPQPSSTPAPAQTEE